LELTSWRLVVCSVPVELTLAGLVASLVRELLAVDARAEYFVNLNLKTTSADLELFSALEYCDRKYE
jgi:hypothetical protein